MEQQTQQPPQGEDKTVAILAYCTLIGFIIAIVMFGNNKTKLGSYHLKQVLGFLICGIGLWIAYAILTAILAFIPFIGWILIPIVGLCVWVGFLVLWIMGLMNAVNGQMKPIPVIGKYSEKWFAGAFN